MARCDITPISAFQSTNLSSKINSFDRLSDRILRSLGYPYINVEVHRDQLYENISIASEMFAKFAGYTREYLVFNSDMYVKDYGIKLDALFTAKVSDTFAQQIQNKNINPQFSKYINNSNNVFIANSSIPATYFSSMSSISATLIDGTSANQVIDSTIYNFITNQNASLAQYFTQSVQTSITQLGDAVANKGVGFLNSFDYDVMDYRKVIAIVDFEEGSTTGINTLFTIEQTLAQQTYFSYAMGNYGFDLISWYVLKDWLKMREKLLSTKPSFDFDDRTQIMRLYPQPKSSRDSSTQYYGVIQCYVERPLKDIIKEQWVYQYSLALTKIVLGRIRGKFAGTTLFGGGSVNADMLQEGLTEKADLEQKLYEGAPGFGDAEPPMFFVG
jgi:hypothetical protein